jgi:hypothetical protein
VVRIMAQTLYRKEKEKEKTAQAVKTTPHIN